MTDDRAFPYPYDIKDSKPTKEMRAERNRVRKRFTPKQFKVIDIYIKEANRRGWTLRKYEEVFGIYHWSEFTNFDGLLGDPHPMNCVLLDKNGKPEKTV